MMDLIKHEIRIDESFYKIEAIRPLTNETFSLKLPKARFAFKAGNILLWDSRGLSEP